ncbi:uncharacterized protein A4U43_C09F490 [Asparagus officinalis]|uniref:Uncharacterized protein n=1 Tax=Asparagus officinalis TaxID=4686 RepID=A0A5P1E7I2_ASPOF|nr:uncharacterized protein A4U43_C09F490 [Asparagus officinalis]
MPPDAYLLAPPPPGHHRRRRPSRQDLSLVIPSTRARHGPRPRRPSTESLQQRHERAISTLLLSGVEGPLPSHFDFPQRSQPRCLLDDETKRSSKGHPVTGKKDIWKHPGLSEPGRDYFDNSLADPGISGGSSRRCLRRPATPS